MVSPFFFYLSEEELPKTRDSVGSSSELDLSLSWDSFLKAYAECQNQFGLPNFTCFAIRNEHGWLNLSFTEQTNVELLETLINLSLKGYEMVAFDVYFNNVWLRYTISWYTSEWETRTSYYHDAVAFIQFQNKPFVPDSSAGDVTKY